jgi:DNA-binding NarL/FixJ family response regulator
VLARRERVEEMLMRGEKMAAIAEALGVRVQMVWRDAKKIYGRKGVRTRAELVGSARQPS